MLSAAKRVLLNICIAKHPYCNHCFSLQPDLIAQTRVSEFCELFAAVFG